MMEKDRTVTPPPRTKGPTHYTSLEIQPWEAMEAWMTPEEFVGFLRGNVIKYLARAPRKGGAEDYRKALHYLEKLMSLLADQAVDAEQAADKEISDNLDI